MNENVLPFQKKKRANPSPGTAWRLLEQDLTVGVQTLFEFDECAQKTVGWQDSSSCVTSATYFASSPNGNQHSDNVKLL